MATSARVVSKGMRWSPESVPKAAEGHYYTKVGEKSGSLTLSGAPNYWKKFPNVMYCPDIRVAGTSEAISSVMTSAGYSAADIQQALSNCYSSSNYQDSKKAAFDAELSAYQEFQKDPGQGSQGSSQL